MTPFGRELGSRGTAIEGLTLWTLPVHADPRGYFKENWQRAAMTAAGLPDFGPVQHNIAVNEQTGVTRGVHAEPWDKFVSVACGRVFGAWVDLRPGPGFGTVVTAEIDAGSAVFVPRGVGNAYQTLEPGTAYSYLVNAHWSPDAGYVAVNPADPALDIAWPIPLEHAVLSEKDRAAPLLASVSPLAPKRALIIGANGQVGRALTDVYGESADAADRSTVDLAALGSGAAAGVINRWDRYDAILNAAAFTAVDAAESADGRRQAWAVNATAVGALARLSAEHRLTLVHFSSDYVFDGSADRPYREDDPVSPLGVYGQSKAAGELAARLAPRHYLLRTSWVIGDGPNFVRTMADLAARGVDPAVVDDQVGRPTFAVDLARAVAHLTGSAAPHGVYHVTGAGEPASWYQLAREVFALTGHDPDRVRPVSTAEYTAGKDVAPRPRWSVLDLSRIESTGVEMPDWRESLRTYLA